MTHARFRPLSMMRRAVTALRWAINPRTPAASEGAGPRPRKVAGILPTRNYTDVCSVFETLKELCDVVLVLDDNSESPFPRPEMASEYLSMRHQTPWNASANLMLLLFRAYVHGCEWVVSLDDDLILSHGFQDRRAVDEGINLMEAEKLDILHFPLRDLWDSELNYRSDGVWSEKTFPVLRRNWFFYDAITLQDPARRLHTGAFPQNLRAQWMLDPKNVIYHTGCISDAARRARVEKYQREDPQKMFQTNYEYMLDDKGLVLSPVPDLDLAIIRRKLRPEFLPKRNP